MRTALSLAAALVDVLTVLCLLAGACLVYGAVCNGGGHPVPVRQAVGLAGCFALVVSVPLGASVSGWLRGLRAD